MSILSTGNCCCNLHTKLTVSSLHRLITDGGLPPNSTVGPFAGKQSNRVTTAEIGSCNRYLQGCDNRFVLSDTC